MGMRENPNRMLENPNRMPESPTDGTVIERVLCGDTESFGFLIDRYQDDLVAYANYMIGSADDAADVVQDSFVRAYKSLRQCKDPARFKAWLFRIVSNQCKTHLARHHRRHRESLSAAVGVPGDKDAPDTAVEGAELRRTVHEALQHLTVDQREALVLKYIDGLSLPEIADLLSTSQSALKMRLLRGREALRERLQGVAL